MTWTTPIKPLAPDAMWGVGNSEWSGTFELICGPQRAQEFLNGGMTTLNGLPTHVEVICEWPHINGTHLRITVPAEAKFDERPIP